MKTIRKHVWETNSSSTNAYTVNKLRKEAKLDTTFLVEDGKIELSSRDDGADNNPRDKAAFILGYTVATGRKDNFDKVLGVISEMTGADVSYKTWKYNQSSKEYEYTDPEFPVFEDQESLVDAISDEYYEYVGSYDYGHPDAEDFMKTIDEFLETEDGIKQFIFSSKQSITCEEYYDG